MRGERPGPARLFADATTSAVPADPDGAGVLNLHGDGLVACSDAAHDDAAGDRTAHVTERAAVDADLGKTEAAIDRYLTAFENATMPEATRSRHCCRP